MILNFKHIAVLQKGKLLSIGHEFVVFQRCSYHCIYFFFNQDHITAHIHYRTMAVVCKSVSIPSGAVDSDDVALIFDRTGTEQCIPVVDAAHRPVGHDEQDIIWCLCCVSTPGRKPQVVAYDRPYPPSMEFKNDFSGAGRILKVFSAVGEEMFFIIAGNPALGKRTIKPIVKPASIFNR